MHPRGGDRDPDHEITDVGACQAPKPVNEEPCDDGGARPPVLVSHNRDDGVVDLSCHDEVTVPETILHKIGEKLGPPRRPTTPR